MTEDRFPHAADDEMLSAYLLGDLPAADAQAFEQRLAAEPELAAQLDALASALVVMGGHDAAVPPEGFEDRLDARLREARADAPVVSLDRARQQRARSRGWWTAIGTAAAVVAVGAVMGANVLRSVGGEGADLATSGTDDSATMEGGTEAALEDSGRVSAGGEAQARAGGDASVSADSDELYADAAPARPDAPTLLDDQARVGNEAALRERYADAPDVVGLLGMPVDQAATVAASFTAAVERAEPFAGGGAPADCLDAVTTSAEQPLIPARVETLRYEGRRALSYVLVTASPGAAELDRVEVWVVAADSCAILVFQQL